MSKFILTCCAPRRLPPCGVFHWRAATAMPGIAQEREAHDIKTFARRAPTPPRALPDSHLHFATPLAWQRLSFEQGGRFDDTSRQKTILVARDLFRPAIQLLLDLGRPQIWALRHFFGRREKQERPSLGLRGHTRADPGGPGPRSFVPQPALRQPIPFGAGHSTGQPSAWSRPEARFGTTDRPPSGKDPLQPRAFVYAGKHLSPANGKELPRLQSFPATAKKAKDME